MSVDTDSTSASALPAVEPIKEEDWSAAAAILAHQLGVHGGCVSSNALRKELSRKNVPQARRLIVELRFFDFETEQAGKPKPPIRWRHHGRSFYTEEAFQKLEAATTTEAESAAAAEPPEPIEIEEEAAPARRSTRQEEARLVTYVRDAMVDLYSTDHTPDRECVFDVHNQRAGSDFENVDVIGVHWRSPSMVELITVEVKLDFTSKLVQQANNYRRFSNRVWIAVPVRADIGMAAVELRETDPRLFEYVIELGLGVLACHRRQGRRYDVFPLQWPRRIEPDGIEREAFIERQRATFEDAGAIPPRADASYPKIR